ncbi:chitinase-3-like protein 1 [Aphidius gifuensis]|nr:chitinase-3-like protein 1 [Aphidius gifuensis]XP_044021361.1 chitinase-3-like protein 1 [Aphidius gifuensis]
MRGLTFILAAVLALGSVSASQKRIVCYVGTWAVYRPGDGKFDIDHIDPYLCTHVIYSFVGLSGNKVTLLDSWRDLPDGGGLDGFKKINALRQVNPSLKTLVAIGGWNQRSEKYSTMSSTAESREEFANDAVAFVKKYGFDGFDIDWEYPANAAQGGVPADYVNYVELLKIVKAKFEKEGLILSAAVAAAESTASQSYNILEMSKYLDFINIMAYDFYGSFSSGLGMNAALKPGDSDTGNHRQLNIDACVNYWIKSGAPKEKLNLGIPFYGRAFTLSNPSSNSIGSSFSGAGAAGPYTREAGMLGYNEICEMHLKEQWDIHYDEQRCVPYAQKGNQWISFDNIDSITQKVKFIIELDLGGAMVWSLETDDFRGKCGKKYPLLNTLHEVLSGNEPTKPVITTQKPTSTTAQPSVTTTTAAPTHPWTDKPSGSFVCPGLGNFADPESCNFYQCVHAANGGYTAIKTQCPSGLCWNSEKNYCDWV